MPPLKCERIEHVDFFEDEAIMSSREQSQPQSEHDLRAHINAKTRGRESQLLSPDHSTSMELDHDSIASQDSVPRLPTPAREQTNGLDDGLMALGAPSRKLIKTIQKLETLQIQSTLPSLPRFVVVGDQSAGKSSIIEALCDIALPRSEGTCTRCPFQITTTSSRTGSEWKCIITLQQSHAFDPTQHGEFGQWHDTPSHEYNFATIYHKADLAPWLLRAQHAILNPTHDPAAYQSPSADITQTTQVPFSPNRVCLDISGPELPDISFYDLPGTINVYEDHRQDHLVAFVQSLVKHYVREEKTLILLACAADQDVQVSTTFKIIRDCKAADRCLGVLTKADLVHKQRMGRVHAVLENKPDNFQLKLGWFITKQLSPAQLQDGVTHAQARSLERDFFDTAPWSSLPAAGRGCYGITNLQNAISNELTAHIREDIPKIIERVQARLDAVDAKLLEFGERDATPILTVRDHVRNIAESVMAHIKGRENRAGFYAMIGAQRAALRKILLAAAPDLDLATPGYQRPRYAVNLCDDEEDVPTPTPTPGRHATPAAGQSVTTPVRTNKRKAPEATPQSNKRSRSSTSSAHETLAGALKFRTSLGDIDETIKANSDTSLMAQASAEVHNILVLRSLEGWDRALKAILDIVRDIILETIETIARKELSKYRATALHSKSLAALKHFGNAVIDQEFRVIYHLLARERYKPSTSRELNTVVEATKKNLLSRRLERRLTEHFDTQEASTNKVVNDAERKKKLNDENFTKNLGPDPYTASVDAFSVASAYYQVAAARFNDNVFQHIDFDVLKALHDNINSVLMAKLNATDAEACAQLLIEDPEREREREQLIAERRRLNLAMEELNDLRNVPDHGTAEN